MPFTGYADVCDVTYPYEIRSLLVELLMKMVVAGPVIIVPVIAERLFRGHSRKLKGSHQSVHSSDTDADAIITLKDVSDLVSAKPFVVIGIDLKDYPGNILILLCTISRFRIVMFVIGAAVDTEDLAENLDIMLMT